MLVYTMSFDWLWILKRFGAENARGGGIDLKLTRNNDDTLEIMLKAREGVIGEPCKR